MTAAWMVDRVLTRAPDAAFESGELVRQAVVVEQFNGAAVDGWQGLQVERRAIQFGDFILDAEFAKLFARPFARVSVAGHLGDPVALQISDEFTDHGFGRERWLALAHQIEDRDTSRITV